VPPPTAVKVVLEPIQIAVIPLIVAVNGGLTVTTWLAVAVQPPAFVTVTV
jgi:hypothetical protein